MLDSFFGSLCADGSLVREGSDRAFAKARSRLHLPALSWLNDQVVARADGAGLAVVVKPVVARSEDQAVFRSGRAVGLVDFSGLRWTSVM